MVHDLAAIEALMDGLAFLPNLETILMGTVLHFCYSVQFEIS